MKFWRTICNFDANRGVTHVEGRVHFELAETKEEAISKSTEYLESCYYTNIRVVECRPETEDEKYKKELRWASVPEVPEPVSEPVMGSSVSETQDDELF